MQRLDGGSAVPAHLRGAIVALGNFDGFHAGHQAVVGRAVARARAEGRPAIVATFDPHPMRFFRSDTPPFRLTTLDQRQELFEAAGADAMLVYGFDAGLAALPARAFVEQRLLALAGAGGVVTGADFTFGKGRDGDVGVLASLGAEHGFSVDTVAPVAGEGGVVSSSRIREHLRAGEPRAAAALLTRPFSIRGVVEHGAKLGRQLGYPTANLTLGNYLRPRYGIYAVRATVDDGRRLEGAANLGVRPTIEGQATELLEPYFFDFDGDLYGRTLDVALIDFIRPEAKFDGLDALNAQMARDCDAARLALSTA
ncbi:bifunctional riboflavin kinase/FAD synthetase [Sphingomonas baiyangensis]|uniref:Riboflavin biosynthesis protein n=1 Tax=Sphingomonas baiyangensis TaxID=2572576 RepID=A0A4U1L477_9SPHN|nr:bifunctional riboflavin kinase/FAD synthetase [Sphingomonas baiyangensis]TKD51003.1 bifunctional riboflavin kinase/FAD synthetase [Sphingomonas baiyangensis]